MASRTPVTRASRCPTNQSAIADTSAPSYAPLARPAPAPGGTACGLFEWGIKAALRPDTAGLLQRNARWEYDIGHERTRPPSALDERHRGWQRFATR